jgi:predicted ATPase
VFVYQHGLPPQATYVFKHALIQEAAYQSLLKSTRQQSHQRIAQVLEAQFADTVATQPELLAYHYTEAGLPAQALPYWQRAGERALERSANIEAIGHLTKGLELLKTLPDTVEYAHQELTLQVTQGTAFIATKGYAAPEVEQTYARARELCQRLGETPLLFRVLGGLQAFYFVRGELQTAQELGEQLLRLAQSAHDPALFLRAHTALGLTSFHRGQFARALEHLEQGITLHALQKRRSRALQDPGVVFLCYAAMALWHLGYPDQVLKKIHEALTLAQELSHPYSLALARYFSTWLHQFRWEGPAARKQAEAVIELATEQGFAFLVAMGTILRGWALAEQGQREEGIAQICQGLAAQRATGAELFRSWYLALLAEAYAKGGQREEGLAVLSEALELVNKNEERIDEAELYRLKGELSLQSRQGKTSPNQSAVSNPQVEAEAEACFQKAIEVTRQQQAKSLELRAVISLARLWQQQGKRAEAYELLASIYGWFTEGFATVDLQKAKALLEELGK